MANSPLLDIINTVLYNNDLPKINELDPKLRFTQDLGLDSIMLAELTVRIEDEYDIDVFEDGMIFTIGDIVVKIE